MNPVIGLQLEPGQSLESLFQKKTIQELFQKRFRSEKITQFS